MAAEDACLVNLASQEYSKACLLYTSTTEEQAENTAAVPEETDAAENPMTRQKLEAILQSEGIEQAMSEITFLRLAELRELAKEYPEHTLTDRNLKRIAKGELLEAFRDVYKRQH